MHPADLTNSGLLLLRVLVGGLLVAHGGLKFLQPGGLQFESDLLVKDGVRGGKPAAAFSGLTQVGAGTLLIAGLLAPLAGAGAIGAMVVAVFAKARNGFWVPDDGVEFPLMFVVLSVVVTLTGPGRWSVDHVAHIFPTTWETLVAVGLGLVAGSATFGALKAPNHVTPPSVGGPQFATAMTSTDKETSK